MSEPYLPENITQDDISQLVSEIELLQQKNDRMSRDLANSTYSTNKESNLIAMQIDSAHLLEKLEHFYRGDELVSEDGNVVWKKQKNSELKPFNDYGVSLLMETINKYIDKNTFLSTYTEERIYEILGDLGDELTMVIYCNYEKMGMNTYFKKTKFRLIISTTLHMIESAYRRSLGGQTREDINQSRIVSQSDIMGRMPMSAPKKHRKFLPW